MKLPVDLELSLSRRGASYTVDLCARQPASDADTHPLRNHTPLVRFDLERLSELALNPAEYGRALGAMLFADPRLAAAFAECRGAAQAQGLALRVRLQIAPDAAELQALRWEALRDPASDAPLALGEQIYFVRHLSSADWQPVRLRARGELRALVAIANPAGLADYRLQPVDVAAEQELAVTSLAAIRSTVLAGAARPTLDAIIAGLRDGPDILYLVCHGGIGAAGEGEPWLALEDERGGLARAAAADLARRVGELAQRPRLAVLVSCQSAGDGSPAALTSLAARLAEAGVPAVLAMQGVITVDTARAFVSTFCAELAGHGQIDRAAGVARGAVRQRPDSWMPALYSRLINGRIWYVPGFGDERAGFEKWPTLIRSIREGRCTPILGPGLLDALVGSSREIARRWADTYDFPLAVSGREELPQVAQFLAVDQDEDYMRGELREVVRQELLRRFTPAEVPLLADAQAPPDDLLRAAAALGAGRNLASPHRVLAGLPFPLYVNACHDSLLLSALGEAGKRPTVAVCPWNDEVASDRPPYEGEPSADQPLVYHLFGQLAEPETLVITEDDYFRYLIGFTKNQANVPKVVRYRLTDTALLFLGFRLDEWPFRVLFRSVMNEEGRNRRRRKTHVAVQIELDERQAAMPDRARRYLERYFEYEEVSIYWGSAEDFLHELAERSARM